ncbi:MAG TPA: hypothetical protein VGH32_01830 [Pirellulales bacterium]|jgi:hypothetical protein
MTFTYTQKLEAVRRELRLRQRVYPNRIESRRMTPQEADYQIKIMEAIIEDYDEMAKIDRLI